MIQSLCCDTTNANLGSRNGAALLFEQILNRDLLYLPCRHHIFELVLGGVFDALMPASTGPSILLFKRFQTAWSTIDQRKYAVGREDERIFKNLKNHFEDVHCFIDQILKSQLQPRDDYRKLLLLCFIFIGITPRENVRFYKPGAFSRARWMARGIYCLKIFLFRKVFSLMPSEEKSIAEICTFIVLIYISSSSRFILCSFVHIYLQLAFGFYRSNMCAEILSDQLLLVFRLCLGLFVLIHYLCLRLRDYFG